MEWQKAAVTHSDRKISNEKPERQVKSARANIARLSGLQWRSAEAFR